MSFLNTSNKRIGGKLDNIKEIFTIEETDGSQYKIDTFEDIIGPSRRDNCLTTLYNNTLSISRIKVEVYQNNVFVYLNGSSTPTFKTTDNSDNKFIIIKVGNSNNVIITYFDHNIGTNNNTYVENNVISCNYDDRNEIVNEAVSPSGSQLLTIYKMTSYAEITRYLSVDGKSFTDRLPYNKSFEEKSHLFINKDDRKFGVISEDLSKVNNVEIEYDNDIEIGSNPIFIEESNFNNSDEFYTVDGNFKPHTLTFIDNVNNSININYNYRLFNNSQNYKGKISFNFYDSNNSNVISFDLFVDKSINMLKIDNVFISDNIKNNVLTNNLSSNTIVNNLENYDFGFAVNFYSGNLELSVKTNKKGTILLFSKVVIDYSNMNLPSTLEKVSFNSSKTYAIRENNNNGYINDLYKEFKFTGITSNYNYRLFRSNVNFTARVEIYKSNVKKLSFDIDVINNVVNIYNVDNRINYYQNYINGDMKMGMGISLFSYQNFIGLCISNNSYIDAIVVRYGEANGKNPIHFEKVSYSTTGEMRILDQDEYRGINYTNSRVNSEANTRSNADTTLQNNINTLSNSTTTRINEIHEKMMDYLPIGSIIPLFKTSNVNRRINNYYLKCDGSLLPTSSVYDNLRSILSVDSENISRIDLLMNNSTKSTGEKQLGYRIGQYLRTRLGVSSLGYAPIIFPNDSFIKLLNDMGRNGVTEKYPEKLNMNVFFSSNFRSSNFGSGADLYPSKLNPTSYYNKYTNNWAGYSYVPSPNSKFLASNQIERLGHKDFYNVQLIFRRVFTNSYYKTFQISLAQTDAYNNPWSDDMELTFNIDCYSSQKADILMYIEIGNRSDNTLREKYAILIPYELWYNGASATYNSFDLYNKINNLYKLHAAQYKYYSSITHSGFNAAASVLELVLENSTDADYFYMNVSGYNNGASSKIRSSDTVYYPIIDPISSYYNRDNPMSLWQLVHNNYRKLDAYVNYNYFNKTSSDTALNSGMSYSGWFNRFTINTDSFLKFLNLDNVYSYEQFDRFWDDLINCMKYKSWTTDQNKSFSTFPKLGGVDISALEKCSTSSSIRSPFKNEAYGNMFEFNMFSSYEKNNAYTGDRPKLFGSRTVLYLKDVDNIYIQIDTDATNYNNRGSKRGFIIHANGIWTDISRYISKKTIDGYTSGNNSTAYLDSRFGWSNSEDSSGKSTDSAGFVRIRFFEEGNDTPLLDKLFIEFASSKNWCDNTSSGAADEGGFGNGFDLQDAGEHIVSSFRRVGGMYNNLIVVIDRIHNPFVSYARNTSYLTNFDDPWDFFDMSLFFDYCNNGNTFWFNNDSSNSNNIYLPDLTEEGMFIGGGNIPGRKLDWTVPNFNLGSYVNSHYRTSNRGGGSDDSFVSGYRVAKLSNDSRFNTNTNEEGKFFPKHYNVDWWIKYK